MALLKGQFRVDMTGTYYGFSDNPKPIPAKDGAELIESDTGRHFRYNAQLGEWIPE